LEHKLFEAKNRRVRAFCQNGASANAYTDLTVRLFVLCSGNFRESLEILHDFVQKRTHAVDVQKEQDYRARDQDV
jgi:predicted Zn-dependent peptidase